MIWFTRLITFLLGFASLWGVVFLIATTFGWERIWSQVAGPPDLGTVEFKNLGKGPKPNQYLVCPADTCIEGDIDRKSPVYALSVDDLKSKLLTSLNQETGLRRVDDGKDETKLRFIHRSRLFRFPDTVSVALLAIADGKTSMAIYSRSQIGESDLGVNEERIKRWLSRLSEFETTE